MVEANREPNQHINGLDTFRGSLDDDDLKLAAARTAVEEPLAGEEGMGRCGWGRRWRSCHDDDLEPVAAWWRNRWDRRIG
uniref:Uncharacterized protein n=1 Tax=Oryza meridionalis TaxID=40149 RepID=A0A0E0D0Z5_9ORYZ